MKLSKGLLDLSKPDNFKNIDEKVLMERIRYEIERFKMYDQLEEEEDPHRC